MAVSHIDYLINNITVLMSTQMHKLAHRGPYHYNTSPKTNPTTQMPDLLIITRLSINF